MGRGVAKLSLPRRAGVQRMKHRAVRNHVRLCAYVRVLVCGHSLVALVTVAIARKQTNEQPTY